MPQCRTVEDEKCEEVKEGYTTVTKCDKVRGRGEKDPRRNVRRI